GTSTASYLVDNSFTNIEFTDYYQYGVMFYYNDRVIFDNNTIHNGRVVSNYGLFIYYSNPISVSNNYIHIGYYGMYFQYINYYLYKNVRSKIHNNMVYCDYVSANYCIYSSYFTNSDVQHNTFVGSYASSGTLYITNPNALDIRNNIIVN